MRCDRLLIGGVGVAVQKAYRHRPDTLRTECLDREVDGRKVGRFGDGAIGERAFLYSEGEFASHQRWGEFDLRVIHVVAVLITDGEQIAKAFGDQHGCGSAFAFDQRIGHHGGGVHDHAIDLGGADSAAAEHRIDPGEKTFQQIARCGEGFVDCEAAVCRPQDDVSEGAADVDGQ